MLKPLVKVIKACSVCFAVCIIVALTLEFVKFSHSHLLQDFSVGAACSFIVVILTTYVQYKVEFKRLFFDYISATSRLIFTLSMLSDFEEEIPERIIENHFNHLEKDFEKFRNAESALVYFTNRETERRFQHNKELNKLYLHFTKSQFESHKNAVMAAYDRDSIISAIDEYQEYWPDCYQKNHIMMVRDCLVKEIEEVETEEKETKE